MASTAVPPGARFAEAADRNKEPIAGVICPLLKDKMGVVVEVACGTGQHAAFFAQKLPGVQWQPTNLTNEDFGSVAAWSQGIPNVLPLMVLDSSSLDWPFEPASAIGVLCVNMTHIAPWAATEGLLMGAGRVLQPGGILYIYGPFMVGGQCTTDSNTAFHLRLRSQNPEWGYRDVADLEALGKKHGLVLTERLEMPANNFSLVFSKPENT